MKKRREYEDDDGRQIVDMNVDGMPWYLRGGSSASGQSDSEPVELTFQEKLSLYSGVIKAVLLVLAVFLGIFFLVILFLTKVW